LQGCASTWSMPRPHMTSPHRKSRTDFRSRAVKCRSSDMKYHSGLRVGSLECHHYLRQHPRLVSRIAWREVKRLDAAHIGLPRNFSGSRGCKMGPVPCQCDVGLRKCRLNEESVRILNERNDGGTIGRRVGDVGNIGNFLAGSDRHEVTQAAKRDKTIARGHRSVDTDQMIIRATLDNGFLQRSQPGTNTKIMLRQSVLPDVHMCSLAQRKSKAGRAMFKDRG